MSQPPIDYQNQDPPYITQSLHIQTILPEHADLAIVFGTRYPMPIPLAAQLYREGIVPLIVVTGGINHQTGENEAQAHYKLLRAENVPDSAILVEDQSTNTLENVVFALPKIAERCEIVQLKGVISVSKWFHARRTLMTLKKHFPVGIEYYARTYTPLDIRPDNWQEDEYKRERVLKNWHNIPYYLAKGDIAEIEKVGDDYYK